MTMEHEFNVEELEALVAPASSLAQYKLWVITGEASN